MIRKSVFGYMPNGKEVSEYTVSNESVVSFHVLSYGGILKNIFVKDKNGEQADVICGFDSLEAYRTSGGCQGALIGRFGNRIGGATFELDGKVYKLAANDGKNCLHGGKEGFHQKLWNVEEQDGEEPSLVLTYVSRDGEENFPGELCVKVTYTLKKNGELFLHYEATTDQPTVVNLTNHSYFNLAGYEAGVIDDHRLWLDCDTINSVNSELIPDGRFIYVKGTPYDFTKEARIGDGFTSDYPMMKEFNGYDNNFVFNHQDGRLRHRATLTDPKSGRKLDLYTDMPCVQIYTANMINVNDPYFKGNVRQYKHCGVCLETQAMPDSMNHEGFTNVVLRPKEKYDTTTVFAFSN